MTTNQSIILLVVGISLFMLTAGYIVGKLVEKRKRDKEMAGIVAARLLQKPQVPEPPSPQNAGFYSQLANANINQQLGAMQGQSNMGLGNYLIGGNPILSQGLPSRFSAIRRSQ